ncbi:MAG: FeoA family protein [Filifactor alocis]|nr:FeoA family protein [Filifactor alocis]
MPISFASVGDILVILEIRGNEETKRHLENLGFVKGETVTIISKNAGNLIIAIKDSRLAINHSMSSKIIVANK